MAATYRRLLDAALEAGTLYEDPDFPADNSSLSFTDLRPSWATIEWKRPKELCDDPSFMLEGSSRFDLNQGILGDCWFVSAAATLATRPALLKKVCHPKQSFADGEYAGIFHFTFWRFGQWEQVVIDDLLPTKNNRLVFCSNRNEPNEFWAALMEKAYAKLHGSYLALETGFSHDALVDFTGGIGEFIDLSHDYENRGRLYKVLRRSLRMRSLMCAAITIQDGGSYEDKLQNGLVTGHSYSITNVLQVTAGGEKTKLLRVRNPWGKGEWNGAWSDGSAEWDAVSDEEKTKFDLRTLDDGEFWLSFEDFLANFHSIQICHLGPDSVLEKKGTTQWHCTSFDGAWIRGVTAGGSGAPPHQATYWMNPQYSVCLQCPDDPDDQDCDDPHCTLVVSLIQKYRRQMKTVEAKEQEFEEAIGFDIMRVRDDATVQEGGQDGVEYKSEEVRMERKMRRYEYLRERSGRFNLHPGTYCVVPCTFQPDVEAQFILRLATEKQAESKEMDSTVSMASPVQTPQVRLRKFDELFSKHAGDDDVMDARELRSMLNEGLRREGEEEFDKETARALITWELGKRGKLTKGQCKRVWREAKRLQGIFNEFDRDENHVLDKKEMRKAFESIGFKLNKKMLVATAEHFCGKNDSLTLDDFVLMSAKLSVQLEKYNRLIKKDASKVNMTLDELPSTPLSSGWRQLF